MAKQNWATNINFHDAQTLHPKSIAELAEVVSNSEKIRARGSAHCFNTIADTRHTAVVLDAITWHHFPTFQLVALLQLDHTVQVSKMVRFIQP